MAVFGLKGLAIAGAVGLAIGTFGGWRVTDWKCQAEAAGKQNQSVALDNAARTKLDTSAEKTADQLATDDKANQEVIREFRDQASTASRRDCRLTDDDVRRLRSIK